MTYNEINELDIVDYLTRLGIQPKRVSGHQYWYLSPLPDHEEKTASFKVNRHLNRWWDFGTQEGSTLVDFLMRYHKLTATEVKEKFTGPGSLQPAVPQHPPSAASDQEKKVEVIDSFPIRSHYLLQYLFERRIPIAVAQRYNREIRYRFTGSNKEYYALGLPNDAGGWELRNKFHKYSADPKGPTTIINGSKDVALFEGNFNMLTLATFLQNPDEQLPDFHITNSSGHLEDSLAKLDHYQNKYLFFDNDPTGDKLTATALARDPSYLDMRGLYKHHNDLNDWVRNIGKPSFRPFRNCPVPAGKTPLTTIPRASVHPARADDPNRLPVSLIRQPDKASDPENPVPLRTGKMSPCGTPHGIVPAAKRRRDSGLRGRPLIHIKKYNNNEKSLHIAPHQMAHHPNE